MSDTPLGDGWWVASDGKWYPPEAHPSRAGRPEGAEPPREPAGAPTTDPTAPYHGAPLQQPAPAQWPPDQPPVPPAGPAPGPAGGGGSSKGLLAALVAVVVVAAGGFLGWQLLSGSGGGGTGASSPEAAVRQFVDSLDQEDLVGLLAVMDPDEVDGVLRLTETIRDIAADDGGGVGFGGIDLRVTGARGGDLEMEMVDLDPDGRIVSVRLAALELAVEVPADDGERPTNALMVVSGDSMDVLTTADLQGIEVELRRSGERTSVRVVNAAGVVSRNEVALPLDLVVIEKRGRWYVSTAYSVAELIRAGVDSSRRPDFGAANALVASGEGGGDAPVDVVERLASAVEGYDLEAIVATMDPEEAPFLHDYWPVLRGDLDMADIRDQHVADDPRVVIDAAEVEISGIDDRLVGLSLLEIELGDGRFGPREFLRLDGDWCWEFGRVGDRDTSRGCLVDQLDDFLVEIGLAAEVRAEDLLPDQPVFVVNQRNGRWYVSPYATLGVYVQRWVEGFAGVEPTDLGGTGTIGVVFGPEAAVGEQTVVEPAVSAWAGVAITPADDEVVGVPGWYAGEAAFATVEVTTTERARLHIGSDGWAYRCSGEDTRFSAVVQVSPIGNTTFGAVAASVSGAPIGMSVTTSAPEVIVQEGLGTVTGTIGADGTPVVVVVSVDETSEVTLSGAAGVAQPFYPDVAVACLDDEQFFPERISRPRWYALSGAPGSEFTLTVGAVVAEPTPTPAPTPTPQGDDSRERYLEAVQALLGFDAADLGFTDDSEQSGGWWDLCVGDRPGAITWLWFGPDGFDLIGVTVHPTVAEARAAFEELSALGGTTCDLFGLGDELYTFDPVDMSNPGRAVIWADALIGGEDVRIVEIHRVYNDLIYFVGSLDGNRAEEFEAALRATFDLG